MFIMMVAEAAAEGASHNPLVPETNELIWGAICFVLLLVSVGPLVFPRINEMMKKRSSLIEGNISAAEKERTEAERLKADRQAKLDAAHLESQRILDQARANADRLEEELRAKAEGHAQRIVDRANESIVQERDRVASDLRQHVGGLAIDVASRVINTKLDQAQHLKLVDQYIDELAAAKR